MSTGQMKDYLATDTADISDILSVTAYDELPQVTIWNQTVDKMDDGTHKTITHTASPTFEVTVAYPYITLADMRTIIHLHASSSKAMGAAKTFYWAHPTDRWDDDSQVYYVVRFAPQMQHTISYLYAIRQVHLWVEAVKAQV